MAGNEQRSGWRWLLEKRRWLWVLLALGAMLGAGGAAWWIGLRWLLVLLFAGSLFLVFHPWDCWIRWRLSWRGQRGEAWFRYLFGALGVGVAGSPAGARVLIAVGPWRRVVFDTRSKSPQPPEEPKKPEPSPASPAEPPMPKREEPPAPRRDEPPSPAREDVPARPVAVAEVEPMPVSGPVAVKQPSREPPTATEGEVPVASTVPPPAEMPARVEAVAIPVMDFDRDPGRLSPPPKGPVSPGSNFGGEPPLPPIPPVSGGEEPAEERGPSLRERLRALRRRFRSTWQKVRKGYRIARDIWNRATEPCRRLLWNLWASFSLLGPKAHLRYGLAEPHIVGMIQGLLAPLAGVLMPFGALIRVEPVFAGPTIWCRGETGLRIHPWRLVWAFSRLIVEREVIRGARDAWRAWRERKPAPEATEKDA